MGLTAVKFALVALLAVAAAAAWAQEDMQAELSISRTIQSQGLLPAAGDYVRYDVTITNTGSSAIEGQRLWADFAPAQGAGSSASFAVPAISPGSNVQLHLGPFKMHVAGEHMLRLGVNGQGDPGTPDEVTLNTAGPADSITAYSPAVSATLPVGMGLIAAGAGFVAWHFARRRRA